MMIRALKHEDAVNLLELMKAIDTQTPFMLYEPGERKTTAEQLSGRIASLNTSGSIVFGAFNGSELLGYIFAQRGTVNRIRHRAYIVIGVHEKAIGRGLGRELMRAVETWAKGNGVHRLEMTVLVKNERALLLYKKCGYEIEGLKKHSILYNGVYQDEYYMGKTI